MSDTKEKQFTCVMRPADTETGHLDLCCCKALDDEDGYEDLCYEPSMSDDCCCC